MSMHQIAGKISGAGRFTPPAAPGGGGGIFDEPTDPGSGYLNDPKAMIDAAANVAALNADATVPGIERGTEIGSSTGELTTGRLSGKALRTNFVTGTEGGVDWQTTNLDGGTSGRWFATNNSTSGDDAARTRDIVGQFWFKASSGLSAADVGFKWWLYFTFSGSDRSEISGTRNHGLTGNGTRTRFHLNPNSGTHSGYQPVAPWWEDLADGAWHRFTHRRKPNTTGGSPSSRDGYELVWIDGTLIVGIHVDLIDVTPSGGDKVWCTAADVDRITTDGISFYKHPAYYNSPIEAGGTLDTDNLKWWEAV
jgi:hypothetical protein